MSAKIAEQSDAEKRPAVSSEQQKTRLAVQTVLEQNQFVKKPSLSFSDFLNKASQVEQRDERARSIQEQAEGAFYQSFFFKGQPRLLFQGTPNYAKDLQGKKYIFIGEASNHEQRSLVNHTIMDSI